LLKKDENFNWKKVINIEKRIIQILKIYLCINKKFEINMIKAFRIITLLEGFSLLVLLFLAMPLKYIWNLPQMVQVVGMVHGILFLLFAVLAIMVFYELKWSFKTFGIVMLASIIPFGAIYIDKKHLKL